MSYRCRFSGTPIQFDTLCIKDDTPILKMQVTRSNKQIIIQIKICDASKII